MADAAVLKEMNLGKIRAVLCSGCSLSKTALAEITGLSFPTVGKIVDEMVKTRELQAMGMQSSSKASECELDSQGRILLPAALITESGIEKECVVVGVADHVEIWAKERWDNYYDEASASFEDVAEQLTEFLV